MINKSLEMSLHSSIEGRLFREQYFTENPVNFEETSYYENLIMKSPTIPSPRDT